MLLYCLGLIRSMGIKDAVARRLAGKRSRGEALDLWRFGNFENLYGEFGLHLDPDFAYIFVLILPTSLSWFCLHLFCWLYRQVGFSKRRFFVTTFILCLIFWFALHLVFWFALHLGPDFAYMSSWFSLIFVLILPTSFFWLYRQVWFFTLLFFLLLWKSDAKNTIEAECLGDWRENDVFCHGSPVNSAILQKSRGLDLFFHFLWHFGVQFALYFCSDSPYISPPTSFSWFSCIFFLIVCAFWKLQTLCHSL